MSKGLRALKRIKSRYNDRVCIDILEDFDTIEKELKALDIIKNKKVNIPLFVELIRLNTFMPYAYNQTYTKKRLRLTPEEYDLLKEVLL